MKRILVAGITLLVLLTLMVGCSGQELTPIEKAQARAVEIGEQYLNYEISAEEAKEMLDSIKVPKVESGNGQLFLEVDINYLSFIIGKRDSSYEEIQEKVEWITSRDYTE